MGTSGTGYVHLKKQEWIYAELASYIAALSNLLLFLHYVC